MAKLLGYGVSAEGLKTNQKNNMNNLLKITLSFLLICSACFMANAQTPPKLKITKDSLTSAQIIWTNQVGTSYHVLFSTNLTKPFSLLEDAFSTDPLVTVYASTIATPIGFFRIQVPTNTPATNVQIFSPSNSVTVSGEISVRMGAQIGTQIQGVNLYLDDALVGYLNSGGMNFSFDTTHFANGAHTVYVGAVDTANNETLSSSITLDFENPVRWLDACSMFNSFVPIDVDSDIFPADWLVTVTDTNGTIVRTITGSTTDGIIQTSWEGTDDNGQPLSVENLYQLTVDVTSSGSSSMMMAPSLASTLNAASVTSKLNSHGVPEFTVQKTAPNPLTAYQEILQNYKLLTPKEKLIFPPLPPKPANNPHAVTTVRMSAREMFFALHQVSNAALSETAGTATPNASSSMANGSTKDIVWWENPWSSGKTVLAYAGDLGFPQNGYVGSAMLGIRNLINTVNDNLGNREVYNVSDIFTLSSAADFSSLTNHLAELSPNNVRSFYFYGHGNTNGNAFGTQSRVVGAKSIAILLGNYVVPPPSAPGKPTLVTHHAYSFVFLDGCNTGIGDFPEAFGIPKNITGQQLNPAGGLHKRAFMGWGAPVTHSILGNYPLEWSSKFWSAWLGNGNDSTIPLSEAVRQAEIYHSGVTNDFKLQIHGNKDLTWG